MLKQSSYRRPISGVVGFTLIELLVVISIISLLVLGLIFFRIQGGFSKQSYYSFQELTAAELIQKKNKYFLYLDYM